MSDSRNVGRAAAKPPLQFTKNSKPWRFRAPEARYFGWRGHGAQQCCAPTKNTGKESSSLRCVARRAQHARKKKTGHFGRDDRFGLSQEARRRGGADMGRSSAAPLRE